MIKNLNHSDVGKWVQFTVEDSKIKTARIKMYVNPHKEAVVVVTPYNREMTGNEWKKEAGIKMRYDQLSFYVEPKKEDHGGTI